MACLAGCLKFLRRNQEGAWVDYALDAYNIRGLRFTVNPGTVLERAWNSPAHAAYLGQWHGTDHLDIAFVSIPVWQLHTNIPCRSLRMVRHDDGSQHFYTQETMVGTWRMTSPVIMELHYASNGWIRHYENVPGSPAWIRRSDTDDVGWSVFLAPLIVQYPGHGRGLGLARLPRPADLPGHGLQAPAEPVLVIEATMVPPPPPTGAVGEVEAGPERVPGLVLVNALNLGPAPTSPFDAMVEQASLDLRALSLEPVADLADRRVLDAAEPDSQSSATYVIRGTGGLRQT